MKLEIEMTNSKTYKVTYSEGLDYFLQEIQFTQGNSFIKSDDGDYLSITKIVRWSVND